MSRRNRRSSLGAVGSVRSAGPAAGPSPEAPDRQPGEWSRRDGWFVVALVAAVCLAYQPAWRAGFIWDDDAHVMPPELRGWHGLWRIWFEIGAVQQYYPLLHTVSWLQYPFFGDNPLGYHLFNIGVHAADAVLFGLVLRRLRVPGAWLAAGIFALHPVMVESVAWITELKNTLSGLFYLLATLAYLRFDAGRRGRWYAASLGLFVLALLSKTTAATLPGALLVVFWWRRGRLSWPHDVRPLLPFFALGAVDGIFVAWVEAKVIGAQGADFAFTFIERGLIAGRVLCFYAGKLLWPAELIFMYPRWSVSQADAAQYGYPVAVLAGLAALGWLARKQVRWPLAAALIFAGTLLPVLGFLNVYIFVFSFVADHLQYMAAMGLIAVAAAGMDALGRRLGGTVVRVLGLALLAGLGVLTWRQSRIYRDAETLYRLTLEQNPDAWLAHGNLGGLLLKSGRYEEAVAHLTAARKFHPERTELQFNLGLALLRLHRPAEAIPLFQAAVGANPRDVESLRNLGDALLQQGSVPQAISAYEAALQLQPDQPSVLNNLGDALLSVGRTAEGMDRLEQALHFHPDNADAHFNLGLALSQLGRLPEATGHFEAVVRLNPDDASAQYNLGSALLQGGRPGEAAACFQAALRLDPRMDQARAGLDEARRQAGTAPPPRP